MSDSNAWIGKGTQRARALISRSSMADIKGGRARKIEEETEIEIESEAIRFIQGKHVRKESEREREMSRLNRKMRNN